MNRTASAAWQGSLKEGKGTLTAPSGVLKDTPYGFQSRFGDAPATNPEELIAAAHAGCFTMAVSAALSTAGFTADRLATTATLAFEKVDDKWTIKTIHLDLKGKVPGIDKAKFEELAAGAKVNCPVSRALTATITLGVTFEG